MYRNVYPLLAVSALAPIPHEADGLVLADRVGHPAELFIVIDPHAVREERMAEGIFWIMEAYVLFLNNHE